MDSILDSVKKLLGINFDYNVFDTDIIMHINTVLFALNQMGVGKEGFTIHDSTAFWNDFLGDMDVEPVKTYVYLKVRMLFDPPTSSVLVDVMNKSIEEYEWRISVAVDSRA